MDKEIQRPALLPLQRGKKEAIREYVKRLKFFLIVNLVSLFFISLGLIIYRYAIMKNNSDIFFRVLTSSVIIPSIVIFFIQSAKLIRRDIKQYSALVKENTRWSRELMKFKRFDLINYLFKIIVVAVFLFFEHSFSSVATENGESLFFLILVPLIFILILSNLKSKNVFSNFFDDLLEKMLDGINSLLKSINIEFPKIERDK
ncbi:hypothetical protein [Winogradskyella sp.]|uniref:hypothetical protein n=1 Tax=Winogradskyella sp. TaxID=1883156 RepID=UPI003BAB7076